MPRKENQLARVMDGERLMRLIASKVNACGYSREIREELTSELTVMILSGVQVQMGERRTLLTAENLTPLTVRTVATKVYAKQFNRFREVSLEHCYDESGIRLEKRLAG